jgi:hypothetical protein
MEIECSAPSKQKHGVESYPLPVHTSKHEIVCSCYEWKVLLDLDSNTYQKLTAHPGEKGTVLAYSWSKNG